MYITLYPLYRENSKDIEGLRACHCDFGPVVRIPHSTCRGRGFNSIEELKHSSAKINKSMIEKLKSGYMLCRASLVAYMVKSPTSMQETCLNPWVGKIP